MGVDFSWRPTSKTCNPIYEPRRSEFFDAMKRAFGSPMKSGDSLARWVLREEHEQILRGLAAAGFEGAETIRQLVVEHKEIEVEAGW